MKNPGPVRRELEDLRYRVQQYLDENEELRRNLRHTQERLQGVEGRALRLTAALRPDCGFSRMRVTLEICPELFFATPEERRKDYIKAVVGSLFQQTRVALLRTPWEIDK